MAITTVQFHNSASDANENTLLSTLDSPTTANTLLIVGILAEPAATSVSGVSDGTSAFTRIPGSAAVLAGVAFQEFWFLQHANAGKSDITTTFSAAAGTYAKSQHVWEVSGFTNAVLDQKAGTSNGTGSGTTLTGPGLTIVAAVEFLAAIASCPSGIAANPKAGSVWTDNGIDGFSYGGISRITSATATETPTWSSTSSGDGFAVSAVSFMETSGTTVSPTGTALTISRGTPTLTFVNNPTIAPTGFGLLASRGTPTVNTGSNFTATPSGTLLTMSLGTFTTETDTTLIGMSVGALTMSLGTATVSSASGATQTPTGFGLTASLGTQTVAIISNPTPLPVGFSLGATLGTPTLVSSGPTEMVSGFPLALLLGVPAILGTTSSVRQRAFCPRPGPFGFFS